MASELERLNAAVMAAFGKTITYTPADFSVVAFQCRADFNIGPEMIDQLEAKSVVDRCRCRIEHASLTVHGLSGPVTKQEHRIADQITKPDFNGSDEVWDVIGKEPEDGGTWLLTLERNTRLAL
ncbi:MAG: hypothetical protein LLG06_10890 [Desulfobacteraceae bacterium]|nr:hypothetical protein [Desulfobacteraceae bacterium]